jgi:hypothetical protein
MMRRGEEVNKVGPFVSLVQPQNRLRLLAVWKLSSGTGSVV